MQFDVPLPTLSNDDPGYVAECQAAMEAVVHDLIASLAESTGSDNVAYRIANATLFPDEHPVAAARLSALTRRAQNVGWAEFAVRKALPTAIAKITVPLIDPRQAGPDWVSSRPASIPSREPQTGR